MTDNLSDALSMELRNGIGSLSPAYDGKSGGLDWSWPWSPLEPWSSDSALNTAGVPAPQVEEVVAGIVAPPICPLPPALSMLPRGTAGADLLFGGEGDDRIQGLGNDDRLDGGEGDDTLDGGTGSDLMAGGMGNDIFVVDATGDAVLETAVAGADTVYAFISCGLVSHVEDLRLVGSAHLRGVGNGAVNGLWGNDGNNILDGRAGGDRMEGGRGNDRYIVDNTGDVVVEAIGAGYDWVLTHQSITLSTNVEGLKLLGSAGLTGTGTDASNRIIGNAGANVLNGHGGADRIKGGAGDDTLDGGTGRDVLNGGKGRNVLWGRGGDDIFVFHGGQSSVQDFADNQDTLRLDDVLWGGAAKSMSEVLQMATFANGEAHFDFAGEAWLRVSGLTSLAVLADDLLVI